jgi:uracil-DNA glycosylase
MPQQRDEMTPQRAIRAIQQRLASLQRSGITHVRRGAPPAIAAIATPIAHMAAAHETATPSPPASSAPPAAASPVVAPLATAGTTDDRQAALAEVACRVVACKRCAELASTRTQTVFGVGNPHARLMFIGEAPGADEDRQGEPFVGRAGQLLTDIIVKGMKMRREDVYIMNTLRCRPPGNRTPAPDEVANCREYFDAQMAIIRPQFLCCLGAVAAQSLLATTLSIGRLRGKLHDYQGIQVLCTYHPAYLLRNPAAKRDVWEDIQILLKAMGQ